MNAVILWGHFRGQWMTMHRKASKVDDVATHATVWIHKHHKPSKLVTASS